MKMNKTESGLMVEQENKEADEVDSGSEPEDELELEENDEKFEEEAKEEKIGKEKQEKKKAEAVVNVYTSFNNTIVHVTDMSGKTLAKVTGGMVTKHGRLKANPTI